jgi:hypothetical protein
MSVAARVMSQSQRVPGLKAHRTVVKIADTRNAAPPNPSVLLLAATNTSKPEHPPLPVVLRALVNVHASP